jgi:hypothetical protein
VVSRENKTGKTTIGKTVKLSISIQEFSGILQRGIVR